MKKIKLLPFMAVKGVIQNKNVYFPYLLAGIFSVFTYFVFASILHNDIIALLPKSAYTWGLLRIGKVLLAIILLFFMFYANSFLIKRRKKEFGLYHILGLEKRHISGMLLFESALLYLISTAGGIISGVVLAKLLFLLLLRMSGLPISVEFVFYPSAFWETMVFFFWVFGINFIQDLIQIAKARPIELMSGSKKGEKEPKFLVFYALLGVLALGLGYKISITSKLNSMIFTNFFLAIFLVVVGTYLLFTSGSIAFLKLIKKKKKIYYKPQNFITVSGMLYRMKKSAASLSNICIFSTMVIITLVCTTALYLGMDEITHFMYPYDLTAHFEETGVNRAEIMEKTVKLEDKYGLKAERADIFDKRSFACRKEKNSFKIKEKGYRPEDDYQVGFLTLEDYNRLENKKETLEEDQVLIYSSGADYGYDSVDFLGEQFQVKKEFSEFFPEPKAAGNTFLSQYFIVVRDQEAANRCARAWGEANGVEDMDAFLNSGTTYVNLLLEGEDAEKNEFLKEFSQWCQRLPGFSRLDDGVAGREEFVSMGGGLLFIGVVFGLIFLMCLILVMYYKQVQEGYEDKNGFAIMQKVGMSDGEIRRTIRRQILMVFGLPLAGALLHTAAGMFMVKALMAAIQMFNTGLVVGSCLGVAVLFVLIYGVSYLTTAKTYYKIVKQQGL